MAEGERQLNLSMNSLPPKTKCLFEIDPIDLYQMCTDRQQYWLNSIVAAKKASDRAHRLTNGQTRSWLAVIQDNEIDDLPTYTPMPKLTPEHRPPDITPIKHNISQARAAEETTTKPEPAAIPAKLTANALSKVGKQQPPDYV